MSTADAMPLVNSPDIEGLCGEFEANDIRGEDYEARLLTVRARGYRLGVVLEGRPCVARALTPAQVKTLRASGLL